MLVLKIKDYIQIFRKLEKKQFLGDPKYEYFFAENFQNIHSGGYKSLITEKQFGIVFFAAKPNFMAYGQIL